MNDETHNRQVDDLSSFCAELNSESDRGLALVSASVLDHRLQETLRSFFCQQRPTIKLLDGATAPLGTFSSRIQCCYSLGLIDEYEHSEVDLIRKVRNEFAHSIHGISFQTRKVQGLCSSLVSDLPIGGGHSINESRFQFVNAVVCMVGRLYYRPEWVALERRKPKVWVSKDETRWRSVEEELPTTGTPVIALGRRANK